MREFTIPTKVLRIKTGGLTITGEHIYREVGPVQFLSEYIFADTKQWGGTLADTRRAIYILDTVDKALMNGMHFRLEDNDASRLAAIASEPTGGWQQFLAMQALPYIEMLCDKGDDNPHGSVPVLPS